MADITSGVVSYGETRKIADYENKTAKVELSFSVADGEDAEAAIDDVIALAKNKLHSMLHGFVKSTIAKPEPAKAVEEAPKAEDSKIATPRRGRPPKVELIPKGPAPEKPHQHYIEPKAGPVSADEFAELPATKASQPDDEPQQVDLEDLLGPTEVEPPAREVTDAELMNKLNATQARIKDAPRIRNLAATKYNIVKGVSLTTMPQNVRAQFLADLDALKANAA
jgi:hypothetical protein